MPYAIK